MTFELADTGAMVTTDGYSGGGPITANQLFPVMFLRDVVDAAKKLHFAAQFAYQTEVSKGNKDVVVPRRTKYIGSGTTWSASVAEATAVNFTNVNTTSGVTLSPVDKNYGSEISNRLIRIGAIDNVKEVRDQLIYACGDEVDRAVFDAMKSDSYVATSSASGSQSIYGGDATQASELAAGDVFNVDMIAKARRKLMSSTQTYATYGTSTDLVSSATKNPWRANVNGAGDFALFIAPEQEEVLLTDSQFVNASEYGSDKVIMTGEIGSYLTIKVITTDNTPFYAASTTHADASTTAVAQHRCIMTVANKGAALAYGQKPRLTVFDYPSNLSTRLIIEHAFKADQLYSDAIVHINVADN